MAWPLAEMDVPVVMSAAFGAIVLGVVLLLWGHAVGQVFLALAGAGLGAMAGWWIAGRASLNPMAGSAVGGVLLASLGALAARAIWAILAGLVVALPAAVILAGQLGLQMATATTAPASQPAADALTLAADRAQDLWALLTTLFQQQTVIALAVVVPAAVLPALLAAFKPRAGAIAVTSLLGAGLIVAGATVVAVHASAPLADTLRLYWYGPAGLVVGVALIGIVRQSRKAKAADAKAAQQKQPKAGKV
jgi:hypothetical protein